MTRKVGDKVVRMLGGTVQHDLIIDKIEDGIITCGWWTFDEETGAEIDDDLDWGPLPKMTGSFLIPEPKLTVNIDA